MLDKAKVEPIAYAAPSAPPGRVHIVVDGIKPLLTHNPESMGQTKGPSKASRIPEPEVEAESGVYRLEDGTCALKGEAFRGSTLIAASAFKGAKRVSMKSVLSHIVVVEELVQLRYRDGTPIKDYIIDRRRVIVQGNGVIRARPRFDEWSCEFTIEFDPLLVGKDPKIIVDIVHDAGNRIGVGDYRPGNSKRGNGPLGRYAVREYWFD